jgi:WD40 repeat protein
MTNFDITSFFKRSSVSQSEAAASTIGPAAGGVAPPPGLGGGGTLNGGGAGDAMAPTSTLVLSSSSSVTGGVSSLLPTHAHHLSYDTDSLWSDTRSSNLVSQPHTTPIAHVTSILPPSVPSSSNSDNNSLVQDASKPLASGARLIDWNDSFLVYVVKGGLIRVIDRRTGLRTLLRGHSVKGQTSYVRDMVFFSRSSDILATVGTLPSPSDGSEGPPQTGVLIWRIYNSHPGGEVLQDCLLELRCSTEAEATHIAWHPFNTNVFVVAHGSKVTVVESTKLQTAPSVVSPTGAAAGAKPHALCHLAGSGSGGGADSSNYNGQVVLEDHTDSILGVSWSIANPRFLFTCGLDGTVRAWDVRDIEMAPSSPDGTGGGRPRANCLWTLPSNGSVGTQCMSLPVTRPPNAPPGELAQSAGGLEPFLVASQSIGEDGTTATSLTLYSSTSDPAVKPHPTHLLDLTHDASAGSSYCVSICPPPPGMGHKSGKPSDKGVYILVSRLNEASSSGNQAPLMFVLHALSEKKGSTLSYKFAKVTPYSLLYPLLSWSTGFSMRMENNDDEEGGDDAQEQQQNGDGESNTPHDDGSQWDITAFVVQTKAVQTLRVRPGPSSALAGSEAGRGVTVISMEGPHTATQPAATATTSPSAVVQEAEAYDMHDDAGEDHYDDDDDDDDDDDHHELHNEDEDDGNDEVLSPALALAATATGGEGATPFANWLGALAQSAPEPAPPTKPTPMPISTPDLKDIPSPPAGPPVFPAGPPVFDEIRTTTSTASASSATSRLLTPTEVMAGKGKPADDAVK